MPSLSTSCNSHPIPAPCIKPAKQSPPELIFLLGSTAKLCKGIEKEKNKRQIHGGRDRNKKKKAFISSVTSSQSSSKDSHLLPSTPTPQNHQSPYRIPPLRRHTEKTQKNTSISLKSPRQNLSPPSHFYFKKNISHQQQRSQRKTQRKKRHTHTEERPQLGRMQSPTFIFPDQSFSLTHPSLSRSLKLLLPSTLK